jgi:hypothetical protein
VAKVNPPFDKFRKAISHVRDPATLMEADLKDPTVIS